MPDNAECSQRLALEQKLGQAISRLNAARAEYDAAKVSGADPEELARLLDRIQRERAREVKAERAYRQHAETHGCLQEGRGRAVSELARVYSATKYTYRFAVKVDVESRLTGQDVVELSQAAAGALVDLLKRRGKAFRRIDTSHEVREETHSRCTCYKCCGVTAHFTLGWHQHDGEPCPVHPHAPIAG